MFKNLNFGFIRRIFKIFRPFFASSSRQGRRNALVFDSRRKKCLGRILNLRTEKSKTQVRKVEKKDIDRLIQLIDQLGYKINQKILAENMDHYGPSAFVLEVDKEIIGCLAYHILPQFHSDERHMRIVSLVVEKKYRGQGVGKKLLCEAERIAKMTGCSVIELTSAAHRIPSGAHAFYLNQGYKADGNKVYFRKELPS